MHLPTQWTLTLIHPDGKAESYPAQVPGCVHTDLQAAGVLPNLFWRDNSKLAQFVEDCDAEYTCTFTLDRLEDASFRFEGLDTYATVSCNSVVLGEADNMFIPWIFPAGNSLKLGENRLCVRFRSPVRKVAGRPLRPGAFTTERLYTRRIQCTYGWDWVDRFVTMGIFRPVELVPARKDCLTQENIAITSQLMGKEYAQVTISMDFASVSGTAWASLSMTDAQGKTVWSKKRAILADFMQEIVTLPGPALWYPRGYGEQPLYTFRCETEGASVSQRFGIRDMMILEPEDAPGSAEARTAQKLKSHAHLSHWDQNEGSSGFALYINGQRIFCQGANWVPCEPFPSAETPEKIRHFVHMAALAGVNMLRVWGGGIFEQDAFYDACDREGILVTQDFLMACGDYPEEDDVFIEQLKKEARAGALRLRNHACLAWWSGDNENAVEGNENMPDYHGRRAALEGIAPVLRVLDPSRRFLPSSPYGGVPYASAVRGTAHNTQYLGDFFAWILRNDFSDYTHYFQQYLARFTAEQPALGMPFASCLRKFLTEEDIFGISTEMSEFHTKNNPGLGGVTLYGYAEKMARGMFGAFADGADRLNKMQRLHGEWVRLSMELFRRHAGFSAGIIYWMFGDCWPAATGWSLLDYYGNAKPGYYAFKRCAKPVIASVTVNGDGYQDDEDGKVQVWLCSNALQDASVALRLYRYDVQSGEEQTIREMVLLLPAGKSIRTLNLALPEMNRRTVLLCDIKTDFGADRAFALPFGWADMDWPREDCAITEERDGLRIYAQSTVPMTFADDHGRLLRENGLFIKKGEERTLCWEKS